MLTLIDDWMKVASLDENFLPADLDELPASVLPVNGNRWGKLLTKCACMCVGVRACVRACVCLCVHVCLCVRARASCCDVNDWYADRSTFILFVISVIAMIHSNRVISSEIVRSIHF